MSDKPRHFLAKELTACGWDLGDKSCAEVTTDPEIVTCKRCQKAIAGPCVKPPREIGRTMKPGDGEELTFLNVDVVSIRIEKHPTHAGSVRVLAKVIDKPRTID